MVCRMFQLRFKKLLSALCPHSMFASFCYESKNKMVVSVVKSIDFFFLYSGKKIGCSGFVRTVTWLSCWSGLLRHVLKGHTIKPGTPQNGTWNTRGTSEQRNTTGTPEHGTPTGRRNNAGITEIHRNNGNTAEQRSTTIEHWRNNGTLKQRQWKNK